MEGHSGLAEAGEDILCAALTSAIRLVECTMNDVLAINAAVKVFESEAKLSLRLPAQLGEELELTCQALLAGLAVHFVALSEENPEHIIVLEV